MKKKNTQKFQKSIIFPIEIVDLIQKIADIEDRTFSYITNNIIKDYFKQILTKDIDNTNKYYSKEILDLINKWQKHDPK